MSMTVERTQPVAASPAAVAPSSLFRAEALARLQRPAAPDVAVRLVAPSAWLALLAVALVVVAGGVWSVFGRVSTFVHAEGLVNATSTAGNMVEVVATEGGILRSVYVSIGAKVNKDDVVARLEMPSSIQAAQTARHTIEQLEAERAKEAAYWNDYLAQQMAGLDTQQRDIEAQQKASASAIKQRTQILAGETDLLPRGMTTRAKMSLAQDRVNEEQANFARLGTSLQQITSKRLELDNQRRSAIYRFDSQLLEARERLADAQRRLEGGNVVANVDGTVVLKEAALDSVVQPGTRILTIRAKDGVAEGLFFADPRQGKRIAVGMPVNVSPSTVEAARYGTITGHVAWVSAVGQTAQAMIRQLGNETLARRLSADDAPIAVGVALDMDETTRSGLRWSSSGGPPFAVDANTLSGADVVVEQEAPVTLVIPALRRFLGVDR